MIPVAILLGFVALLPLVWFIVQSSALVSRRNYIRESWSNVDTELKRRYDLIPNLVATVKGYAAHERAVLERVVELRHRCAANTGPVADQDFLKLQGERINTENRIQAARRFYNGNVRDYQNKRESFPSDLVAGLFHFPPHEFFSVPPSVAAGPIVNFGNP